jgi:hypothetical protein
MEDKIFKDKSAWYYSEDPDYFNESTALEVDSIEHVYNGDITSPALLIIKDGHYGIYFHISSSGEGEVAVFENKMSEPFPFSDLDEMRYVIKETHPDNRVKVLKEKVAK